VLTSPAQAANMLRRVIRDWLGDIVTSS
jgi:hypothetical protein